MLVSCPKPQTEYVPRLRLLFIALEAVFTWVFWALPKPDNNYGFPKSVTWDRSTLAWKGASSHNPLRGIVEGTSDLDRAGGQPEEQTELRTDVNLSEFLRRDGIARMMEKEKQVEMAEAKEAGCEEDHGHFPRNRFR